MVCPIPWNIQKLQESGELENEVEDTREKEEAKYHALHSTIFTTN